jgi:hypothetical protein
MSAEFMLDSGDGVTASTYGEFHLTLTLAGDADGLRERLCSAAEKLGYRIISDDPLVARRGGTGYGSIGSITSTVLDYARTLTFRLKPAGTGTTLVTFNYVGYPLNYKGARVVITREAEAIAALASVRQNAVACSACGAEAVDDSRFCRRCGVPMLGEPAELQVLQLTNDAHAGTRDVSIGVIGFALAVITFVLIIGIKGMGELTAAAVFTLMWALPSLILMVMGFRHLFRTFSPKQTEKVIASGSRSSSIPTELSTGGLTELPPISVTENTTNLLTPLHKIKEPVLVERKDKSVS